MNDFMRGLMWTRVFTDMMMRHADKVSDSKQAQLGYRLACKEMQLAIDCELEDWQIQEKPDERTS